MWQPTCGTTNPVLTYHSELNSICKLRRSSDKSEMGKPSRKPQVVPHQQVEWPTFYVFPRPPPFFCPLSSFSWRIGRSALLHTSEIIPQPQLALLPLIPWAPKAGTRRVDFPLKHAGCSYMLLRNIEVSQQHEALESCHFMLCWVVPLMRSLSNNCSRRSCLNIYTWL